MSTPPQNPSADHLARITECLREGKPVKLDLADNGRIHVDRPLPFLLVHAVNEDRPRIAAHRIVSSNASYLLTSDLPGSIETINLIAENYGPDGACFAVIEVTELDDDEGVKEDSPFLAPFEIRLSASDVGAAGSFAEAFERAACEVDAEYRSPRVEICRDDHTAATSDTLSQAIIWIKISIAPIYRKPGSDSIYPDLLERMTAHLYDAILQGLKAHLDQTSPDGISSHRHLGRRGVNDAVYRVDAQVDKVASAFDFLLSVTPINSEAAWHEFSASDFSTAPRFLYRPLEFDPEDQKRELYSVSMSQLEDPVLLKLYEEKRQELDVQLSLLQARGTSRARDLSRVLYGPVEPQLKRLANVILSELAATKGSAAGSGRAGGAVDCEEVKAAADDMIRQYGSIYDRFIAPTEIRDDLPGGLMVSGDKLLISNHTAMSRSRLEALLSHEIGVHLLTYFNGDAQGLKLFRSGLAGYEGFQEGLAVFAEYAVGGMTKGRLRLLAARVIACDAMLDGAEFPETYSLLTKLCHMPSAGAFSVALRVYRSGGLAKDAIYLRGLMQVLDYFKTGDELTPLWSGKIAASHLPVIRELSGRGLLKPNAAEPLFVSNPDSLERIKAARSGLHPVDMLAA